MGVVVFIVIGVRVVVGVVVVVLLLPVLHHCFVLFYGFFYFIKFKLTLNFCNYLFGSVALFYFILEGIK